MSDTISKSAPSVDQMLDLLNNIHLPVVDVGYSPLPLGSPHHFDVALGTVISGWLYADGSVYNIADYPELANHYASHHGASNFYGGNGTTTFAVPDLRGEFLRGSGTNGHANQGNGAGVGVHQDATERVWEFVSDGTQHRWYPLKSEITSSGSYDPIKKPDSIWSGTIKGTYATETTFVEEADDIPAKYTSRPTNTSYPIYIKATPPASGSGHEYSTQEQVVGIDTDRSPIYEITFADLTTEYDLRTNEWVVINEVNISNVNKIKDVEMTSKQSNGGRYKNAFSFGFNTDNNFVVQNVRSTGTSVGGANGTYDITIRYTKTSD